MKPDTDTMPDDSATSRVVLDFHEGLAEIALDSGPLNLVTRDLLRSFNQALGEVEGPRDIRCLIVHGGKGRAFCAGSNIHEFEHLRYHAAEQKILFEDMVLRRLARMPMPTIAAIDGAALGGGLEIALACDLRVCRKGVVIGLPESRLGGLAGNGAARLTRLIGPARAKELLFTGDTITAEQACAWGIVNRVLGEGSALEGARELAATIASRGPLSNQLAKQLVDAADDVPLDAVLAMSTTAQQRIFSSDDLHEGVAAFFSKRPPVFKGQ